jgi:hypothetical protein
MARARLVVPLLAATLVLGERASADVSARLVYARDSAATVCPDESVLRRAVEARLGYDPFLPWASATVVVRFSREDLGFAANVEMFTGGESKGARKLRSDDPGCSGLVDAAALAVSIALDAARPQPPATPPPSAEAEPVAPVPTAPAIAPDPAASTSPAIPLASDTAPDSDHGRTETRASWRPVAGLDALVSTGSTPSVAPGLAAWGRLQAGHFSAGVEVVADLPSSASPPQGGTVSSWLVAAGLAPCLHLGPVFACGVGELGGLHASGAGVSNSLSGSGLFAAVGPRVGIEVPITTRISLRLRADVLVDLSRATVMLDGTKAWQVSPASGTLGGGIVVRFP